MAIPIILGAPVGLNQPRPPVPKCFILSQGVSSPPGDIPEDGTAGMLPAQGTISMYEIGIAGQDRAGANTRTAPP